MIPGVTCCSCVFFSPPPFQSRFAGQSSRGQCRRHAPIFERTDQGPRTIWPLVNEDQWCGEHASQEAVE